MRDEAFSRHIRDGWQPDRVMALLGGIEGLRPQRAYEQRAFKCSYLFDDAEAVARAECVLAAEGIDARVVASHDHLLDVLPARAGKGAAMTWVAERFGIADRQIVAFGDSGNDADMLEACANAVMVANHSDEIAYLRGRSNVRVARWPHAHGVVEGLVATAQAERRLAS